MFNIGHIGTFLLFSAFILLLITSLSAPVIPTLGFLNLHVGGLVYRFGAWGWCQTTGTNTCSSHSFGYPLGVIVNDVTNEVIVTSSLRGLTQANILVPIATGFAFLAFIVALFAAKITFAVPAALTALAFMISVVIMIMDFSTYGMARHDVNRHNFSNIHAGYSSAMWMLLTATICLLIASIFMCVGTCQSSRDHTQHGVEEVRNTRTHRWMRRRHREASGVEPTMIEQEKTVSRQQPEASPINNTGIEAVSPARSQHPLLEQAPGYNNQ